MLLLFMYLPIYIRQVKYSYLACFSPATITRKSTIESTTGTAAQLATMEYRDVTVFVHETYQSIIKMEVVDN